LTGFARGWFLQGKPVEELYDTKNDRDEVVNLTRNRKYSKKLEEMRHALNEWQSTMPDACLLPESEMYATQKKYNMPVADFLDQNTAYYNRLQHIANQSLFPEENVDNLLQALNDSIPSVRFWAIRGIGRMGDKGTTHFNDVIKYRKDPSMTVQASLAWALANMGMNNESLQLYRQILKREHKGKPDSDVIYYAKIFAVNDLTYNNSVATKLKTEIRQIAGNENYILRQAAENVLKELE
jgi:HEAT repeat protein